MKPKIKVFGIGLSRTGTKSCFQLMDYLGFSSIHYPSSLEDIDEHVFSNDSPISSRFEDLDKLYPGSLFIYSTRELDKWVLSCLKLFSKERRIEWINSLSAPQKEWYDYGDINLYGVNMAQLANINSEELVAAYKRHEQRVRNYFKNRSSQLLEIDLTNSSAMPLFKVIRFLEQHGMIGMPHANLAEGPFVPYTKSLKNNNNSIILKS